MEKENMFFSRRRIKTEKEKEENIWRRKVSFFAEEREKEENIWRSKHLFVEVKKNREGKEGKYLKKENIFLQRNRNNRDRKGYLEKEIIFFGGEGKYLEKKIYLYKKEKEKEGKYCGEEKIVADGQTDIKGSNKRFSQT